MSAPKHDDEPGSQDSTHIDDLPGFGEDEGSTTSTSSLAEGGRYAAAEDDLYDDELLDFELEDLDEDVATHTAPGRADDPRR